MSLRDRILAELDRREQASRAAIDPPFLRGTWRLGDRAGCRCCQWVVDDQGSRVVDPDDRLSEHIATHHPHDALRRYQADRERLEEHHPCNDDDTDDPCGAHSSRYECCPCHTPGPCVEQHRIAEALGITPDTLEADRADPAG